MSLRKRSKVAENINSKYGVNYEQKATSNSWKSFLFDFGSTQLCLLMVTLCYTYFTWHTLDSIANINAQSIGVRKAPKNKTSDSVSIQSPPPASLLRTLWDVTYTNDTNLMSEARYELSGAVRQLYKMQQHGQYRTTDQVINDTSNRYWKNEQNVYVMVAFIMGTLLSMIMLFAILLPIM